VTCGLEDGALHLSWREVDGPPVKQPERNGFGSELLHGEIGYRLKGKIETKFNPDGLAVLIQFPITR
jgi:two-component system CheB/CheR fusion protein